MNQLKMLFLPLALLCGLVAVSMAPMANATPFANPDPTTLLDDIDGSGYFIPEPGGSLGIKLSDIASGPGSIFGFFFQGSDISDPANLIVLFDETDAVNDIVLVDFAVGFSYDHEDSVVQSTFTPMSGVPIGFFFQVPTLPPLFSDASLNSGFDVMGAFPALGQPTTYALLFDAPGIGVLGLDVVTGIRAVPTPGVAALLVTGLMPLAWLRIRQRRLLA
ncbi:MAG: hypothetical protein H6973_05865 [Gammaproteobacteria bacterium]|nr:hypothetical protein [Gammaproteobacteria bacterium]